MLQVDAFGIPKVLPRLVNHELRGFQSCDHSPENGCAHLNSKLQAHGNFFEIKILRKKVEADESSSQGVDLSAGEGTSSLEVQPFKCVLHQTESTSLFLLVEYLQGLMLSLC